MRAASATAFRAGSPGCAIAVMPGTNTKSPTTSAGEYPEVGRASSPSADRWRGSKPESGTTAMAWTLMSAPGSENPCIVIEVDGGISRPKRSRRTA